MDDVEEICTGQTENRIFDMIHMMAEKRQKEALELYYDLLALKEPPMRILFFAGAPVQHPAAGEDHGGSRDGAEPDR